ncbi:MAG TPA: hypothetical protein VG826_31280 [Pirellulales bacterium]|nr:hypothetical protein [Pirellulales bacterium]
MANSSKSGHNRRRLGCVERLEGREVLSADFGLGSAGFAHAAVQHFDFSITGTQVFYSPLGLPSEMKGTCYVTGPGGASLGTIGTYDETLQPIFAPVGPGGSPAFVGATGVCTFDFDLTLGNGQSITLGSIVCDDTSMITGALPNGTILVDSTHSPIVSASGICAGLSGTFDGHSQVLMGATFSMHTDVDFAVTNTHRVDMQAVLDILAVANNLSSNQPQTGDHHDHGGHDRHTDRYAAIDSVFAADCDDFWR